MAGRIKSFLPYLRALITKKVGDYKVLKFTCNINDIDVICTYFIDKLSWAIKGNKVQTLVADHYDKDIVEKLMEIVEKNSDGFIFDREDLIGEEPYGFVSDFFEEHLSILEDVKSEFPDIGIDGYVFVNEYGVYDCVMRQRVFCSPEMDKVEFIDQLQCICCNEWVDANDCHVLIEDGFVETSTDEDGCCLLPSVYHNSGIEAAFCLCSEDCREDILESVDPDFARELDEIFEQNINWEKGELCEDLF